MAVYLYNPIEKEPIYCPMCYEKIGMWDGKASIEQRRCCHKCKSMIAFDPKTKKERIMPIPKRTCSSGMTFYL